MGGWFCKEIYPLRDPTCNRLVGSECGNKPNYPKHQRLSNLCRLGLYAKFQTPRLYKSGTYELGSGWVVGWLGGWVAGLMGGWVVGWLASGT